MPSEPRDHDAFYHRLFSHPGVVAQLLTGFVAVRGWKASTFPGCSG
jgi:hypothetical protein